MNILIIKLGALGDVMRTTPLLTALKKKYPVSKITWIVDKSNRGVLENIEQIDRLWEYSKQTVERLSDERFDLAVNLDKEEEALDSVLAAPAAKKMGFGRDPEGRLFPLSQESEYAYRLGIDDELKFKTNRKSYQQISFEQVGLKFAGEEYDFAVGSSDLEWAAAHLKALGVPPGDRRVGLNTGSGARFAGKRLPLSTLAVLAEKLHQKGGVSVLLLGGKDEEPRNRELAALCSVPVFQTGSHSIQRFGALVALCDALLSGDTTAMHVAIAVKTPLVVVFGATAQAEIELYGRGEKIVSNIECAPCYKPVCPIGEACMEHMDANTIFAALQRQLESKKK